MLVLSRFRDEKTVIQVGDRIITMTICDVRGGKVRMGWEADADIQIFRAELWEAIQREGNKRKEGGK